MTHWTELEQMASLEALGGHTLQLDPAEPDVRAVSAKITELQESIRQGAGEAANALGPINGSPLFDEMDDQAEFARQLAYRRVPQMQQQRGEEIAFLEKIKRTPNPYVGIADLILNDIHRKLKSKGYANSGLRDSSRPVDGSTGLTLVTILWETRNQVEHWQEPKPLGERCQVVFQELARQHPADFPKLRNRRSFQGRLNQHSYALDVLLWLGWDTVPTIRAGLDSLSP